MLEIVSRTEPKSAAHALVDSITDPAKQQMREMRDEIDNLLNTMEVRQTALKDAIDEHAEYAAEAMKAKEITAEAFANIRQKFQNGLPPVPPVVSIAQAGA